MTAVGNKLEINESATDPMPTAGELAELCTELRRIRCEREPIEAAIEAAKVIERLHAELCRVLPSDTATELDLLCSQCAAVIRHRRIGVSERTKTADDDVSARNKNDGR